MKTPYWPIQIPIEPDELLSSWLIRTSLENGSDPMTWTWYFWGKWRAWIADFDRHCDDEKLQRISFGPFNLERLRNATLYPTVQQLTTRELHPNTNWLWVIPQGSRNRERSVGMRFCPECLKDGTPYFRKSWRLAWNHSCPKHKLLLMNQCPKCGLPISPHKASQDQTDICICPRCQFDLRTANTIQASDEALSAQEILSHSINEDGSLPWDTKTSAELFETVHLILGLFQYATRRTDTIKKFREGLGLPICMDARLRGHGIEQLSPESTSSLFISLNSLMKLGIDEFIELFIETGVTQNVLFRKSPLTNDTLEVIARQLTTNENSSSSTRISTERIIKPRSKSDVLKMWEDLQRYL